MNNNNSNGIYCDLYRVYIHKNSVWKHNKSDEHINNLRYQNDDNYADFVEVAEWLFKEKQVEKFVNPYRLKLPLSKHYNVILFYHNPIDFNSELKVVGKYIQYVELIHTNNVV